MLAGVYTSTGTSYTRLRLIVLAELFMIQDKSENFADTTEFLDRRLADIGQLGQAIGKVVITCSA